MKKCVTTFRMFGKNAGNFQYDVRPCQHWGNWRRGSMVRTSVCSWRTLPDLRLIHG